MKKLLILLLALCVLLCFAACGETADGDTDGTTTTTSTSASTTTTTQDSSKITYTVTVVNEQNEPIAGAMVQLCDNDNCFPSVADANGVATFSLAEATYKVSFLTAPEGYAVEEAYYFEGSSTELTITLKAA